MGGNQRLNDFLSAYDLYMDNQQKYSSKAAIHYRKHVTCKSIPSLVDINDFVLVDDNIEPLDEGEGENDNYPDLDQSINLADHDQKEMEESKVLM